MKKLLLSSSAALLLILSCSRTDMHETPDTITGDALPNTSQVIPPDEALGNLADLMGELYGGTKAASLSTKDLQVFGGVMTKSGNVTLPDTAVYVLNFPDSTGYAVMAAQRRMRTPVFCVTESGSLSVDELHQALTFLEQEYTPGDGTDDADSAFVSVGEKFVPMLLAASAVNQWIISDTVTAFPYDGPFVKIDYIYRTVTKIGPLLETKWHQHSPFNDFRSDGAPAGCEAVATAQILAYNEYGNPGGRVFDWDLMKTVCPAGPDYTSDGKPGAKKAVSEFMQFVGSRSNCNIKYSKKKGSSGYADGAKRTLRNFGYGNVRKYYGFEKADKNRVISMLTNRYPVYTDGSKGLKNGHAWVIDGLYVRDKVKLSTGETSRQNLFHINWGWNGQSDGYYSQGVFDATKCISTENGVDENPGTQTYRYTWNYRTITYSL